MNNELQTIGAEWKKLDDSYDAIIQGLIDTGEALTPERMEELKKMQKRLFELETELFKILKRGK